MLLRKPHHSPQSCLHMLVVNHLPSTSMWDSPCHQANLTRSHSFTRQPRTGRSEPPLPFPWPGLPWSSRCPRPSPQDALACTPCMRGVREQPVRLQKLHQLIHCARGKVTKEGTPNKALLINIAFRGAAGIWHNKHTAESLVRESCLKRMPARI